jgi:malonate-semialdehyde dehydrogenase (acetylating)/methylmalonate-semialdehyde dehydrogenase
VHARATALGKRALCLGGAKNHLIVAPDADDAMTVKGVVDSFTGCAGQRCMAASVLVVVGAASRVIDKIVERAATLELGRDMGALIDGPARKRLVEAIARAETEGARVVLDGRKAAVPASFGGGNWLGPTVLDGVTPGMDCAERELFGPVLSVIRVNTLDEALALDEASPYGNATSIFTQSGAVASYVSRQATSGMVGVNVGVPFRVILFLRRHQVFQIRARRHHGPGRRRALEQSEEDHQKVGRFRRYELDVLKEKLS